MVNCSPQKTAMSSDLSGINEPGQDGRTVLMSACYDGSVVDVERLLVESGADVNQISRTRKTSPLFEAINGRNLPVLQYLLDLGETRLEQTIVFESGQHRNALSQSVVKNVFEAFRLIVERSQAVPPGYGSLKELILIEGNAISSCYFLDHCLDHGYIKPDDTQVLCAITRGATFPGLADKLLAWDVTFTLDEVNAMIQSGFRLDDVKRVLAKHPEIDPTQRSDRTGMNALHALLSCVRRGDRAEFVDFLLERGVDLHQTTDDGVDGMGAPTPILMALRQRGDNLAIVEHLIARGARMADVDHWGNNCLWYACLSGVEGKIALALEQEGIDINATNDRGQTVAWALHGLAPRVETVEMLVARGLDLTRLDHDGGSPLMVFSLLAASATDQTLVKYLLEQGASLAPNRRGETVLHEMVGRAMLPLPLVRLFVEAGVDLHSRFSDYFSLDIFGMMALEPDRLKSSSDAVNYLKEKGRGPNYSPEEIAAASARYPASDQCVICCETLDRWVVMMPCGHIDLCQQCCQTKGMIRCVRCRRPGKLVRVT
jgi:ankyrin repeat protein